MEQVVKIILFSAFVLLVFSVGKYTRMKRIESENKLLERYISSLEIFCEEIERKLKLLQKKFCI